MTEDQKVSNSTDYLQRFGYRLYEGKIEARWKRVLNLMIFEFKSSWLKGTFAKIMMIIIFVINFMVLLQVARAGSLQVETTLGEIFFRDGLHSTIANYMGFPNTPIISNPDGFSSPSDIGATIGIFLMIIFGLTGSGFFADDKSGKVIEIYLSRLRKREYFLGKFGAITLYINIFILVPLMVTCVYLVEVTNRDHLDYLNLYFGLVLFSLLSSIILGLFILTLSILVEKRAYASLIFVLVYIFGTLIGGLIAENNIHNNKFTLLLSPANFFALLAYVCLGDYELGVHSGTEFLRLGLNDGYSLEYWHVLLQAFIIILVFSLILVYKLQKMTTEELS